ncbi:MAG TPA: alanine racemase [Alphaproteobacteria bacterium]|nr:alanine racemase [Alphaproteobacteria bacterium]
MILPPNIVEAVRAEAGRGQGRSFYLYDTSPMRAKIRHLQKIMPKGVDIFYAMKANPHAAFLAAAKEENLTGIEIASLGEAAAAVAAGFSPAQLIYTGPGKTPEELTWSIENGVRTVHVESLAEAHRLEALCRERGRAQDILLRVNPNFHIHGAQANFSGDSSKLGIDEKKLHDFLPQIVALPHLRFRGLHVYAASGVLDVADLLKNCELVFAMARDIESRFAKAHCDIIDFGGGFGIDYLETGNDFSPEDYAHGLQKLIDEYGFHDRHFVLELGRYLAADSGWYCTEILDIKDSLGKKQVICAGGAHHFRRPVALNINHPMAVVAMQRPKIFAGQDSVNRENVFVGGPLCNSADKLAPKDVYLDHAEIGDMIVIGLAGAYGLTMSHIEFLGHPRPREVVVG